MEEIDKNKKLYLLLGILLIIIFAIAVSIFKSNGEGIINYSKIKSGQDLLNLATVTYDRQVYYTLDGIITNFVKSYEGFANTKGQYIKYEDFYDALNKTYRNRLGKNKYLELAQNFLSKFEYTSAGNMESQKIIQFTNTIRGVYDMGNASYVCVVGRADSKVLGYIGITLNTQDSTYEIFYLE